MKKLLKIGLLAPLLHCSASYALNPVEGFYGGLFGTISHGPSNDEVLFREDAMLFRGTVGYSMLSGGGGLALGYKFSHYRGELELFINRISTGPVTVGSCVIQNKNVVTPTGACPAGVYDSFQAKALGYSGSSTATYGLINGIWDFFPAEGSSNVVPYVGLGVGKAQIKNGSSFVYTNTQFSHGETRSGTGSAFQGIVGFNYFMDDFTWCSLDFRYISASPKLKNNNNLGVDLPTKNYTVSSINISIFGAFDKGALN